MKAKFTLISATLALFVYFTDAQQPSFPKPDKSKNIPFGQKQPAPSSLNDVQKNLLKALYPGADKLPDSDAFFAAIKKSSPYLLKPNSVVAQQLANRNPAITKEKKGPQGLGSNFHVVDVNQLAESDPGNIGNYIIWLDWVYPVANNIAYFEADDGVHGRELMRSDGTAAGTYLVKDINPGEASTLIRNMIAIDGKIYFSASTDGYYYHPWVTDGTEAGTQIIDAVNGSYSPQQFIRVGSSVYFIADGYYYYRSAIWRTDGTFAGTSLVTDIGSTFQGYDIEQATAANGLLFFSLYNFSYGRQLWRSDGTDIGTYSVSPLLFYDYGFGPLQLTPYNNELFFSFDDGTGGHKLWVSDGTVSGTIPAPGNHDIILPLDYLSSAFSQPFPVLNNVLYLSGNDYTGGNGTNYNNGLYKYDASTNDGLVLVKQITSNFEYKVVIPGETRITGNTLYMKVISETGGYHDELWKSNGDAASTQLLKSFVGEAGSYMINLKSGYGTLYFFKYDATYGSELWKSDGTTNGTTIVKDVNPGPTNSQPWYMTELNGKVIFSLHEIKTGSELWSTNGTAAGTAIVKDINTTATQGSYANVYYNGAALNDGMVFHGFQKPYGDELCVSNGTQSGTKMINDISPGENPSYPKNFSSKNNYAYFIGFPTADGNTATVYRTNGQSNGLKKIFSYNEGPYIFTDGYYRVADNGIVFTMVFNWNTYNYELWRSDGTAAGSFMVASNLYYNHCMVTCGNNAFFVAGDLATGYELWKSDGTIAGTKMVKDIVPGDIGSYPYSIFSYNGNVYFGASDENYNPGFWKSDGTAAGTTKVANLIVPYLPNNIDLDKYETISGNTLYLNAFSPDTYQSGLWKTNGTTNGTQLVSSLVYPYYMMDVKGTLFFAAYDQNGIGLWKSGGQAVNTKLVKNMNYYSPQYLTTAGGKLYFVLNDVLWSSDGTEAGTQPVNDPFLSRLNYITNLMGSGNKIFFSANTYQYGFELFVGNAGSTSLNVQSIDRQDILRAEEAAQAFKIYPNPVKDVLNINYYQQSAGSITLTITDVDGRIVLNKYVEGSAGNQSIPLSVKTLPAGTYFVRLNGEQSQVKQFVKHD
jgi:ELWxxDGT repeat protein